MTQEVMLLLAKILLSLTVVFFLVCLYFSANLSGTFIVFCVTLILILMLVTATISYWDSKISVAGVWLVALIVFFCYSAIQNQREDAIRNTPHEFSCGKLTSVEGITYSKLKESRHKITIQTADSEETFRTDKADNLYANIGKAVCVQWIPFQYKNHPNYVINVSPR